MRVTDHLREEVVGPGRLAGREGITYERCVEVVRNPRRRRREGEEQIFWGYVAELPGRTKWLKVVTDADVEVLITAHKDRRFARMVERGEVEGGNGMRITYYEETDSAVIVLRKIGSDTVGEVAGEDLSEPAPGGVVLHRDDAGELYEIEIYSGASARLALDKLDFERVPAGANREKARTPHVG